MNIEEGIKAPDFTLLGSDKKEHKLSDYLGKNVVLYFYPKDNTAGCTKQACAFRDNFVTISNLNSVVLGISRDSLNSHDKFIEKINIPYVLLSDSNEDVCKLYDVLKEKNMYGKKSIGIERNTFIIDKDGFIKKIFRKVKVDGHIEKVLEQLK